MHRDQGPNLEDTDIVDRGFGGFTIRAFTRPTTSTHAKMQLLIFPLDKDTLLSSHPLARTPCFMPCKESRLSMLMAITCEFVPTRHYLRIFLFKIK